MINQCSICNKNFTTQVSLKRHVREVHNKQRPCNPVKCSSCGKLFSSRSTLCRHKREVHKMEYGRQCTEVEDNQTRFCCLDCNKYFYSNMDLRVHLDDEHEEPWELEELEVNSLKEFKEWLAQEEISKNIHYVLSRGSHQESIYYECWRTPTKAGLLKVDRKRAVKNTGSCKMSFSCTSQIILRKKSDTEGYKVSYFKTHYGHAKEDDLLHLRLSQKQKKKIASKLLDGASVASILQETKSKTKKSTNLSRIDFLKRQDIANIKYQTIAKRSKSMAAKCPEYVSNDNLVNTQIDFLNKHAIINSKNQAIANHLKTKAARSPEYLLNDNLVNTQIDLLKRQDLAIRKYQTIAKRLKTIAAKSPEYVSNDNMVNTEDVAFPEQNASSTTMQEPAETDSRARKNIINEIKQGLKTVSAAISKESYSVFQLREILNSVQTSVDLIECHRDKNLNDKINESTIIDPLRFKVEIDELKKRRSMTIGNVITKNQTALEGILNNTEIHLDTRNVELQNNIGSDDEFEDVTRVTISESDSSDSANDDIDLNVEVNESGDKVLNINVDNEEEGEIVEYIHVNIPEIGKRAALQPGDSGRDEETTNMDVDNEEVIQMVFMENNAE